MLERCHAGHESECIDVLCCFYLFNWLYIPQRVLKSPVSARWHRIRAVVSTQDGSHTCCCRAALLLCVLKAEGLTLNRGGCAPLRRLFCLLLLTWETPLLTLSANSGIAPPPPPPPPPHTHTHTHIQAPTFVFIFRIIVRATESYFWIHAQTICYDAVWFIEQNPY